jgi:hypothetical protein
MSERARRIRMDSTASTTVVTCTDCAGVWLGFTFTKIAGYRAGARHEIEVHGVEPEKAHNAGNKHVEYEARKAEKLNMAM